MHILIAVVLTANGPSGLIFQEVFVTNEQCLIAEEREAPKLTNVLWSGCLEIPYKET